MAFRVLFLYNAVAEAQRRGAYGECMTFSTISTMAKALEHGGHQLHHLNLKSPIQLREFVKYHGPFDIAFCIAEGFLSLPSTLFDGSGTAWVRKILADLNVPMTHSSAETMEICRQKDVTYQALTSKGIRVPAHFVVRPAAGSVEQQLAAIEEMMSFPLFVKPCGGGNSIGISEESIVHNVIQLRRQVCHLIDTLGKLPVSVETYLPGQEYTIGVVGNEEKLVLPILSFPTNEVVRSFAVKNTSDGQRSKQKTIGSEDTRYWRLYKVAVDTFTAVGANDVLRIDVREDSHGNPLVIDVNGTPTLTTTASLPFMAREAGIDFPTLLNMILDTALDRVYAQDLSEISG